MKEPNNAPMYAALYPGLAKIARSHGYALAVHGTLGRDMDLICVPWVAVPSEPDAVVDEITKTYHIRQIGEPDTTYHGRERRTISIGFGECFLDLSFMPRSNGNSVARAIGEVSARFADIAHCMDRGFSDGYASAIDHIRKALCLTPNVGSEGRRADSCAASISTEGLGTAVPSAPTFQNGEPE